ncbi:response regulator transcription factor [Cohnella cholangitidis]|uniref:Response regulator transcription factor n=1 Tax=Cohnella cholangitidis TaxID=2598458 RepID=A0A7G5BUN8_9BACL|nr:response regulator transcription factor [Cohnella cholangitidis]QMV40672.1 response regulator transcription factor [Cohnella cholangitidis]
MNSITDWRGEELRIIKVMLVEEDVNWQQKIAEELSKEVDIEVVKVVKSDKEAMEVAVNGTIDVILMDVKPSGYAPEGSQAIREMIAKQHNRLKIIMHSTNADRETIVRCFQNGAVNYLNKSNCGDRVAAIRDAFHNRSAIHSDVAEIIREELKLMTLTPTEREVYQLKNNGFNKRQIAARLFKSENTVKTQMRSIRDKLLYWG